MPRNVEISQQTSKEVVPAGFVKIEKVLPFNLHVPEQAFIDLSEYDVYNYLLLQQRRLLNPVYKVGTGFECFFPDKIQKNKQEMLQELLQIGRDILFYFKSTVKNPLLLNQIKEVLFDNKYHLEAVKMISMYYQSKIARLSAYAYQNNIDISKDIRITNFDFLDKNGSIHHSFVLPQHKPMPLTLDLEMSNLAHNDQLALSAANNIGKVMHPLALYYTKF